MRAMPPRYGPRHAYAAREHSLLTGDPTCTGGWRSLIVSPGDGAPSAFPARVSGEYAVGMAAQLADTLLEELHRRLSGVKLTLDDQHRLCVEVRAGNLINCRTFRSEEVAAARIRPGLDAWLSRQIVEMASERLHRGDWSG